MKQNAQTNEQNPNKTHKQSNETQANPQKKKKKNETHIPEPIWIQI